jgi:hypothetical protein
MRKYVVARSGYVDIGFRTLLRQAFPNIPQTDISVQLKRQALFFDQICIYNLDFYFEQLKKGPLYQKHKPWLDELGSEIQWLFEQDVIIDLDKAYTELPKISSDEIQNVRTRQVNDTFDLITRYLKKGDIGTDKLVENLIEGDAIQLREYVLKFSNSKDYHVVSDLKLKDYQYDIPNSRMPDVVEIVISNLPIPSMTTSWEKIIDYRQEPQTQRNLVALRRWISKIVSSDLPTSEIEEEYKWLVNEYQSHMRLQKLKADTETLQTVVKLPFELLEDLIKLRLSKVVEPFFALRKREIQLMEAELNAPGREIAYILKAREAFPSEE